MIDIFIIDNYTLQKDNGLNSYINELCNGLKKINDVQLHYVWIGCTTNSSISSTRNGDSIEITIPKFNPRINNISTYEFSIAEAISLVAEKFKSPIIHFNWINHCSIANYLKLQLKCITILTKHCIPWMDLITHDYNSYLNIKSAFDNNTMSVLPEPLKKEQLNYEDIDHIIAVTDLAKRNLVDLLHVNDEKISVVHNGIDTSKFITISTRSKNTLRKKYGFKVSDNLVLYAGSLNRRKGVIDLIEAFELLSNTSKVKNLKLILAGSGDFSTIINSIECNWSKIIFMGSLPKKNLLEIYKIADVGVIPSYVEQCSYCAIEMMLSATPIIATNIDGLNEVIPEGSSIKISLNLPEIGNAKLSINGLKEALLYSIANPDNMKTMGTKAQIFAKATYTRERMIQQTLKVYNLAISRDYENGKKKTIVSQNDTGPLVSIIMPIHNCCQFLPDTMDDILKQSYQSFELIVIDDGSVDSTFNVLSTFKDARITVIKNNKRLGIVNSLNKGISLARGKYIARMDADDRMDLSRIKVQVDFLEQNPDYGLIGSWYNIIDKYGKTQKRVEGLVDSDLLSLGLLFSNQFAHPSVMFRAGIIKGKVYDAKFEFCEDFELWTRFKIQTKIANLPNYLTSYRIHETNTSRLNDSKMKQNVMRLLSRELDALGIEHTVDDLALHSAIGFGLGPLYFKIDANRVKLHTWIEKICSSVKLNSQYKHETITKFKQHVYEKYCQIY